MWVADDNRRCGSSSPMGLWAGDRRLSNPRCRDEGEEDTKSASGHKSPRKHWLARSVHHDLNTLCHPEETDNNQCKTRTDHFWAAIRAYGRTGCAVHRSYFLGSPRHFLSPEFCLFLGESRVLIWLGHESPIPAFFPVPRGFQPESARFRLGGRRNNRLGQNPSCGLRVEPSRDFFE
jgi:hypothetical protein